MKIIVNNGDIYPSPDALSEFLENGINCEVIDDSKIAVKFTSSKTIVAENKDMTYMISKGMENADESLSYFLINGHRIIASGNLQKTDDGNYACDGPFRVFSNIDVSTFEYILASQNQLGDLYELNQRMLNSTSKDNESKKSMK